MPKNPLVRMLLVAVVTAWIIYDMATATEAPSQPLKIMQYVLLACSLLGLVGTGIQLAAQKSGGESS
jgi:hypothetical protein